MAKAKRRSVAGKRARNKAARRDWKLHRRVEAETQKCTVRPITDEDRRRLSEARVLRDNVARSPGGCLAE